MNAGLARVKETLRREGKCTSKAGVVRSRLAEASVKRKRPDQVRALVWFSAYATDLRILSTSQSIAGSEREDRARTMSMTKGSATNGSSST